MTGDQAMRVGQKLPDEYEKMGKSVCSNCGATYSIIHRLPFKGADRVQTQIEQVKSILVGEHGGNFKDHQDFYELDDD